MWQDPIVKETRELRKQYADKFNNDADSIFEDILKRQKSSNRKRFSFPARKPKSGKISPDLPVHRMEQISCPSGEDWTLAQKGEQIKKNPQRIKQYET